MSTFNIYEFQIDFYPDIVNDYLNNNKKQKNILLLIMHLLSDAQPLIHEKMHINIATKILHVIKKNKYFNISSTEKNAAKNDIIRINKISIFDPINEKMNVLKRWDTLIKLSLLIITMDSI